MQLLVGLELQIKAAQDLDASRREKDRLDASVRQIETQIQRFNELHVLKTDHGARTARITELADTLSTLDADLDNSVMSAKNLHTIQLTCPACMMHARIEELIWLLVPAM